MRRTPPRPTRTATLVPYTTRFRASMVLRGGSAKMAKSDPSDMSRVNLTDDADTMMQKVRKARTDPEALPSEAAGLEGRAEARNLVGIYATLADTSVDA